MPGTAQPTRSYIAFRYYLYIILHFGRDAESRPADICHFIYLNSQYPFRRHSREHESTEEPMPIDTSQEINSRRWHYSSSSSWKVNIFEASFTLVCLYCANKFYSDIRTVAKLNEGQWRRRRRQRNEMEKNKLFGRENPFQNCCTGARKNFASSQSNSITPSAHF